MPKRLRKKINKIDVYHIEGVQRTVELLFGVNQKAARPAIAKGMRAGLTIIRGGMRAQAKFISVRNSTRHRFKRRVSKNILEAKVGANVGPPRPPIGSKNRKKSNTKGGFSPIGIGIGNAHWYALGTSQRKTRSGAKRGVMPPNEYISRGYENTALPARAVILNVAVSDFAKRVRAMRLKQPKTSRRVLKPK